MSTTGPRLSIVVAAPPNQEVLASIESLKGLDFTDGFVEIIIARGRMPSIQRNVAVQHAKGKWLYFLDDDSMLRDSSWNRVLDWVEKEDVDVIGGPNLCPNDASFVQSIFAVLLGSALTFGPSRARYMPIGKLRPTSEKELILCNLLIRKVAFEKADGFDEALYPNEENALMEAIAFNGGGLYYDPSLVVMRYPRTTIPSFLYMLFRYGGGRAQQFRRHPSTGSLLNMVPAGFLIYLLSYVGLFALEIVQFQSSVGMLLMSPLLIYTIALLGQMLVNVRTFGVIASFLAMPMMLLCHLSYGAGFIWKCFSNNSSSISNFKSSEVVIEKHLMTHQQI